MKRRTTTTRVEEILDTSTDVVQRTTFPGENDPVFHDQDRTSNVALSNTETTGTTTTDLPHLPHGRTPSDLIAGFQTSGRAMATILALAAFAICYAFIEIKDYWDWVIQPLALSGFLWAVWFGGGYIEKKLKSE